MIIPTYYGVPLAFLNLQFLTIKVSPEMNMSALSSIKETKPQAQRVYFHRGSFLPKELRNVFDIYKTVALQWPKGDYRDKDGRYTWSLTMDENCSLDVVSGIWFDRVR